MNGDHHVLGIAIGRATLPVLIERAIAAIADDGEPQTVVCANPHSLVIAQQDAQMKQALLQGDPVIADGSGVKLAARLLDIDVGPRITGHDYFLALMAALNQRGNGRVYFFGSTDTVLAAIEKQVARQFPGVTVCGAFSPPFGDWSEADNERFIAAINRQQPDVLWVGMTAPKQEKWVNRHRLSLSVPVVASIGAVFDFVAGTHPRAPAWLCRMGMEWLYRLVREPARMWRRNFISTPLFIVSVIRQKWSARHSGSRQT